MAEPLIEVRGLKTWFPVRSGVVSRITGHVRAVDGVDLTISQGETLGLVGESGCGKSTLGRSILRLVEPTAGEVYFRGKNILRLRRGGMRRIRREMAIIFQDPFASLDPRQTVGDILGEALDIHRLTSIQAQIINLLEHLQEQLHLTYLFIAHDLSVVKHISDRVAVMYVGKVVEVSPAGDLYRRPRHPYTGSLLSAIPIPDPRLERSRERIILKGDVASALDPPSGCRFRTRCFKAQPRCAESEPPLDTVNQGDHQAACYYPLA